MSGLATVHTVSIVGIEAKPAVVEVHVGRGLPSTHVVGLGDAAVRESTRRLRAAFDSSGMGWPRGRITVNLAPADIHKHGSSFDLPIAAAIAVASGIASERELGSSVVVGELGLDGSVKGCGGSLLPAALYCKKRGLSLVCPDASTWEVGLVEGCPSVGISTLSDLLEWLRGARSTRTWKPTATTPVHDSSFWGSEGEAAALERSDAAESSRRPHVDVGARSELVVALGRGQATAVEALVGAAAGRLDVLLWGPPGAGKTLLGRSAPLLLPDLDEEEAIEVRMLHAAAGIPQPPYLSKKPPFRAPHHSASSAALVGGGHGVPRPGEISLAHHGVLFLDEMALFSSASLEALRQPLEDGVVRIARSRATVEYPARPMVVAATNLCRCGAYSDAYSSPGYFDGAKRERRRTDGSRSNGRPSRVESVHRVGPTYGDRRSCRCGPGERAKFLSRISGPLLDRFDMAVRLAPPEDISSLLERSEGPDLESLRERVRQGRRVLREVLGGSGSLRDVRPNAFGSRLALGRELSAQICKWAAVQSASARRVHKLVKVMWALAATEGEVPPNDSHFERALEMYSLPEELLP